VREVTLGAYGHQEVPFEKLVEELQPERSMSHAPLFQVKMVMQNVPETKLELPGLSLSVLDVERGTSQFDLILVVADSGGQLRCMLDYSTDLFTADTIMRLMSNFETLLSHIIAKPDARLSELKNALVEAESRQWSVKSKAFEEAKFEKLKKITRKAVGSRSQQPADIDTPQVTH
jgi:non-ribosomal peptide synthetase component F